MHVISVPMQNSSPYYSGAEPYIYLYIARNSNQFYYYLLLSGSL